MSEFPKNIEAKTNQAGAMLSLRSLDEEVSVLRKDVADLDERIARFETGAAYEREETPSAIANTALRAVSEGPDGKSIPAMIACYELALKKIANMED